MDNSLIRLFVYGSLRSGFRNPAYEYLAQFFTFTAEAMVKGRFYNNGNNPVAIPADGEHFIIGELYTMQSAEDFSWAFGQLDDYEGINTVAGQRPLYRREKVSVFLADGMTEAWIYWYNGDVTGMPEIDTSDALKYLQQNDQS